jgi:hypothetical protein
MLNLFVYALRRIIPLLLEGVPIGRGSDADIKLLCHLPVSQNLLAKV